MNDPRQMRLSLTGRTVPRDNERPQAVLSLRQGDIAGCWRTLFSWDGAGKYQFFFLDLPNPIAISQEMAAQYAVLKDKPGIPIGWTPSSLAGTGTLARISVSIPAAMRYGGHDADVAQEYCVALDGIAGAVVPEFAAHVCSASFAAGLVARLTLAQLVRYSSKVPTLSVRQGMATKLQEPFVTARSNLPWVDFARNVAQQAPFQAAGIFHGWQAGSELAVLTGNDVAYRTAAWKLLCGRFSWDELGELTAYALNYIVGYFRCQDVLNDPTLRDNKFSVEKVVNAVKADSRVRDIESVLCTLFEGLIGQLRAVGSENLDAGKHFRQFLSGYHRGGLRAAEIVFSEALSLGYGIGYADGFNAGYYRGYADGYRDGYDAANANFWNKVFSALKDAASVASSVETIVVFFS